MEELLQKIAKSMNCEVVSEEEATFISILVDTNYNKKEIEKLNQKRKGLEYNE